MGLKKFKETEQDKTEKKETQNSKAKVANNDKMPVGENPYLFYPEKGIELLSNIIKVGDTKKEEFKLIAEIEDIVKKEFLPLSENDENPTGAQAYDELLKTIEDLEETVMFPELIRHPIVAVGGMFSAGKSFFLNSVMGLKSLLPTETTPTTSIPTYISKSDADSSYALNCFQHKANLDIDAIHAISHDFFKRYNAAFGHIIKLISIEKKDLKYSNMVFLDTPGYSKADDIYDRKSNVDEQIALEHLRKTDYLIWLIDIQNGTIPSEDIEFIKRLNLNQPVLYVFNKADKKTPKQCEEVVKKAWQIIKRYDLPVYDVIAFSAKKSIEIGSSGIIEGFFKEIAGKKEGSDILFRVKRTFSDYTDFYKSHKKFLKNSRAIFNEIIFDEVKMSSELIDKVKSQGKRYKTQIDSLAKAEIDVEKIQKRIEENILKISEIIEVEQVEPKLKLLKSRVDTSENSVLAVKLAGHINFGKNKEDSVDYDNKTPAEFSKILNPMGAIFKTSNGVEILVSLKEIKKVMGLEPGEIEKTFRSKMKVLIHRTDVKKCVVECSI